MQVMCVVLKLMTKASEAKRRYRTCGSGKENNASHRAVRFNVYVVGDQKVPADFHSATKVYHEYFPDGFGLLVCPFAPRTTF
jgi:hypothetical protein